MMRLTCATFVAILISASGFPANQSGLRPANGSGPQLRAERRSSSGPAIPERCDSRHARRSHCRPGQPRRVAPAHGSTISTLVTRSSVPVAETVDQLGNAEQGNQNTGMHVFALALRHVCCPARSACDASRRRDQVRRTGQRIVSRRSTRLLLRHGCKRTSRSSSHSKDSLASTGYATESS